jgi:glycosyltransferase involved in cell wall biosynthesis
MLPAPSKPRHVAMLVRNRYTHDTRVEKEARTLSDEGWRVTVVADAGPDLPSREVRDGVDVLRVPRSGPPIPGLRFLLHELRLARVLESLGPEALHAHDSNALLPVALAARRIGRPFVYDAHELWLHRPRRGRGWLYSALFSVYYRLLHRWAIPRASATVTVSPPIARHLERHYGLPSVHLVPNYPEPPREPRRHEIRSLPPGGLPAMVPIILHLGGIMAERGLDALVDALPGMRSDAHVVLLGEGEHWGVLERRARERGVAERLHRRGPVPSADVIGYAASATVGIQTTPPTGLNNRYSLPNKLFQYMAAGIPVVASDFSQVREIVEASRCGLVVDTTRPELIAAVVNRILSDEEEARAMGEQGRQAVIDRYNWATSAEALVQVYRSL